MWALLCNVKRLRVLFYWALFGLLFYALMYYAVILPRRQMQQRSLSNLPSSKVVFVKARLTDTEVDSLTNKNEHRTPHCGMIRAPLICLCPNIRNPIARNIKNSQLHPHRNLHLMLSLCPLKKNQRSPTRKTKNSLSCLPHRIHCISRQTPRNKGSPARLST